MSQNKYALARYKIIDRLLRKNVYVKSMDIVDVCSRLLGCSISQRTIQLDFEAMRNDPFLGYFAPIGYCPKNKAYFYEDTDFELFPYRFSKEEIITLEYLYEYLAQQGIDSKYSQVFRKCIDKIKFI